ncbi:MAG: tRNA (guanosine(46)-N7)-methyltransferase TrmB [Pseudomonadales bacterium]|nr:tRNA (guanosine(46)-N7)-methyltransferase TrmB [Pseudomonadales bacterium]
MSIPAKPDPHIRTVKSYVVRGGRLTSSQKQAIDTLWQDFGLVTDQGLMDQERVFSRRAPLTFELGFGMGDSLLEMARLSPQRDFVGVDVHLPGIGALLRGIKANELNNIRIYRDDGKVVLRDCFADDSIDCVQIFFPDPWHKKKHHKRRLIQPEFMQLVWQKLRPGGTVHLATDWENYAEHMLNVMGVVTGFRNRFGGNACATDHGRPATRFEKRGERLGHGVWDLIFEKTERQGDFD